MSAREVTRPLALGVSRGRAGVDRPIADAVIREVARAGGDAIDAADLAGVWERLAADRYGHTVRLAYDAANPACSCADRPELSAGRCERGHGAPAGRRSDVSAPARRSPALLNGLELSDSELEPAQTSRRCRA